MACCTATEAIRLPIEMSHQSEIIKGNEQIHSSKFFKDSKNGMFISFLSDDARTLYETFRRGSYESNNGPCLGWRDSVTSKYQWMTFNETLLKAKNFGCGLVNLGVRPHDLVGIYSSNRPEWTLFEQGAYCYSLVVVALYDTLGPDACAFIIKQTDMSTVIVEDDIKANMILDKAPHGLRRLITITDSIRSATITRAKNRGVDCFTFDEVERSGSKQDHPVVPPNPEDICTICYTSGTTGNPKGVTLTHQNVVAAMCAVLLQLGDQRPRYGDIMLSYLPLAHMLERCCENGIFYSGAAVGFSCGNIRNLTDDLRALKPTIMPAVPRLLNRVYDTLMSDLSGSPLRRLLYNTALKAKESELNRQIIRKNSIWDKLVFRKIQESFGGNLRLMIVGSAPLAGNVMTFMRCALSCIIVEGYGQTECTAPVSLTICGDSIPEHVGPPVACCCVKLVDVPEMEYFAIDNQGEVCVKGTNVFRGYYKDPERTAEVIDSFGWHHTGDVGMWLANGTLKIIDRRKHTFKLSQGEYIVPDKIEAIYVKSQYILQNFVYGESLKSGIVAIVVPDVDVLKSWAKENHIPGTLSVLCSHKKVKELILNDMLSWGKQNGLKSFEQVKDIYLHPDPFSIQNGLLTPMFKLKRPQIKNYFKPQLDDMYTHLP
ncbi:long-chain-fatty-acid--CoA ligase 1 isoform X2 [Contarinia nasturtii]|nr:long-chain-fatty-acid--CoA ligase 1 isoform X2 [Contarinia nasturtii]XP_031624521.1 long-chain-fatty-acid--CoA ligase 1 isoform X2 [Contarinia nasturtii]XP_031624529.1 long-chain-fatty-acid--CoA ligase 1 isoform X2 [Contarinia nasturtii]